MLQSTVSIVQAQWRQTMATPDIDAIVVNGNDMIAGSRTNGVYLSTNNDANWKAINFGLTDSSVYTIRVYNNYLFAGTINKGIFRSSNYGVSWDSASIGLPESPVYSFISFKNNICAGTYYGVYISTNNGNSWEETNSGLGKKWANSFVLIDSNLFVGTWGDGVFRCNINAINWSAVNDGLNDLYISSFAVKGNRLFVGTSSGVFLSNEKGANWINTDRNFTVRVYDLVLKDTNLYAGTDEGVFIATSDGKCWTPVNNGLPDGSYVFSVAIIGLSLYAGTAYGIWQRFLSEMIVSVDNEFEQFPKNFILAQNYPNPFNSTTKIGYSIPKTSFVTLKVYDILGREVAALVNGEKPAGNYEVEFNGNGLSSGIYFYKISVSALPSQDRQAGNYSEVKKMIFLK